MLLWSAIKEMSWTNLLIHFWNIMFIKFLCLTILIKILCFKIFNPSCTTPVQPKFPVPQKLLLQTPIFCSTCFRNQLHQIHPSNPRIRRICEKQNIARRQSRTFQDLCCKLHRSRNFCRLPSCLWLLDGDVGRLWVGSGWIWGSELDRDRLKRRLQNSASRCLYRNWNKK